MRKILSAIVLAFVFCGTLVVAEAEGQQCYRLGCNQSNSCTAVQAGPSGKCCCNVTCTGGEGGVQCTCSTSCETSCGMPCPSCNLCQGARAAAGEQGLLLTPESHDRVRQEHLLAAQVLENVSGGLSHPVYSGTVEGKSNVDSPYDYSYKVRVSADRGQAVMEFVFDQIDKKPVPAPVRLTIDELGNVFASALASAEADAVRAHVTEACSKPALITRAPSLDLPDTRQDAGATVFYALSSTLNP